MRKRRWWACLLVATVCLAALGSVGVPAETVTDERGSSVDVVIVMDQSGSMRSKDPSSPQNDPLDYRLDAAQMIISMCDMDSSRVAFLPFAEKLREEQADKDFVDISDVAVRRAAMSKIEQMRGKGLGNDTDLGFALSSAVKLLLERDNTSNEPMIIVLTDGQNSIRNPGRDGKRVLQWNADAQAFQEKTIRRYAKEDADTLMKAATEVAAAHGIPIYTIALYSGSQDFTDANVKEYVDDLKEMADLTGGESATINSENANELPQFFGRMLATQIGSNLLEGVKPTPVEGKPGRYAFELPVLNQSVLEANITIPKSNIATNMIWLYDANGNDVSRGNQDVTMLESGNFRLYKLREPRTLGMWRLEFEVKDEESALADISFSLLYNYNISLKTRLGKQATAMGEADAGIEASKKDTLTVASQFYNPDGTASGDHNLYKVQEGEAWKSIKATYTLQDAYGTPLFSGEMQSAGDRFTAEIDLRTAYVDDEGFNALRSGEYQLHIVADGAGLYRENTLPITLRNNEPVVNAAGLERQVIVDSPTKPETQAVQVVEVDLTTCFLDLDNDKLTFGEMDAGENARNIIDMRLVQGEDGSVTARGETIRDASTGLFRHGRAVYTLTAADPEGSAKSVEMEIHVFSETDDVLGKFDRTSRVDGIDANGVAEKNSDIVFSMNLDLQDGGGADTTGAIRDFEGALYIYDANNTGTYLEKIPMVPNDTHTKLEAVFRTPNRSADYKAICQYTYGPNQQPAGEMETLFRIQNTAPQVVDGVLQQVPQEITYDPLPAALSFLEQVTPPEMLTISLEELFTDADNELGLEIDAPVFTADNPESDANALLGYAREGDRLTLIPQGSGNVTLSITAKDGDGEEAIATYRVRISSLVAKWRGIALMALVALIALVLLILAIVQMRKPKFPRDATLLIKEGVAAFASDRYEFSRTKKTIPLRLCVDEEIAAHCGVGRDVLEQIQLRPMHSAVGSIRVRMTKENADYRVELAGTNVGKRWMEWAQDQELILQSRDSENQLRIQFTKEHMHATPGFGGGGSFGGDDPFGGFDSDDSFGGGGDFDNPSSFDNFSPGKNDFDDFGGFDGGNKDDF